MWVTAVKVAVIAGAGFMAGAWVTGMSAKVRIGALEAQVLDVQRQFAERVSQHQKQVLQLEQARQDIEAAWARQDKEREDALQRQRQDDAARLADANGVARGLRDQLARTLARSCSGVAAPVGAAPGGGSGSEAAVVLAGLYRGMEEAGSDLVRYVRALERDNVQCRVRYQRAFDEQNAVKP